MNIPLFIYPFFCWGHLSYFHFRAIMNKATTFFYLSFCGYVSSVLLRICLGVVRLSHKASISLALVDIAKQFSKVIVPFSPPQAVYKISSCFTSSLTLYIVSHFNFSNSGACGISLWFWFPFPWLPIMPNIFSNTYWPSFLKSCSILLPI